MGFQLHLSSHDGSSLGHFVMSKSSRDLQSALECSQKPPKDKDEVQMLSHPGLVVWYRISTGASDLEPIFGTPGTEALTVVDPSYLQLVANNSKSSSCCDGREKTRWGGEGAHDPAELSCLT